MLSYFEIKVYVYLCFDMEMNTCIYFIVWHGIVCSFLFWNSFIYLNSIPGWHGTSYNCVEGVPSQPGGHGGWHGVR